MFGDAISIQAFIKLVEQKPELFSEHRKELKELVDKLPEKDEQIVKALEKWMEQLPDGEKILDVYDAYLEAAGNESSGADLTGTKFGGATSSTKPGESSQPSKELLRQAIAKNTPLHNPDAPPPKS